MRVEAERLAKLSEAERNVRFWPVELDEPGLVLGLPPATPNPSQGSGLPFGAAAETRAYALVGPQATMTGLAERFLETVIVPLTAKLPADSPFKAVPDRSSLARALAQVCATTVSAQERYVLEWRTGTLFPLPMQRSATGWLVFLDKIQQVPAGNLLVPDPTTVPAGDLVGPTAITPVRDPEREAQPEPPSALTAQVTALIGGKTPEQVATALAHDLLDNPYATCLRVVEALIQLEAHAAADGKKFAAAMVAAMLPPQLSALAATTGGNAVLRRCWARLTSADPMFEPASQALDLVVRTPAQGTTRREYFTPQQRRPAVVPIEPPLTKDQTTVNGHVVGGIALGRRQTYGWTDAFWPGPFAPGVVAVRVFDTAHGAGVPWPTGARPDLIAARRHVVATIGPIEGQIDAVRLADTALLSIGTSSGRSTWTTRGLSCSSTSAGGPPTTTTCSSACTASVWRCATRPAGSARTSPSCRPNRIGRCRPTRCGPRTRTRSPPRRERRPGLLPDVRHDGPGPAGRWPAGAGCADRQGPPGHTPVRLLRLGAVGIQGHRVTVWAARCTIALQSSQALQESELAVAAFRFTRVLDDERVWAAELDHRDADRQGPQAVQAPGVRARRSAPGGRERPSGRRGLPGGRPHGEPTVPVPVRRRAAPGRAHQRAEPPEGRDHACLAADRGRLPGRGHGAADRRDRPGAHRRPDAVAGRHADPRRGHRAAQRAVLAAVRGQLREPARVHRVGQPDRGLSRP